VKGHVNVGVFRFLRLLVCLRALFWVCSAFGHQNINFIAGKCIVVNLFERRF